MKKKWLPCIILAVFSLLTGCGRSSENSLTHQPELPFTQELQNALKDGLVLYGGMGISAAVIVPGYQMWSGVSGISHGTTPITPETLFSAGSINKMYTAVTILQLAAEGVLNLDDPINQ